MGTGGGGGGAAAAAAGRAAWGIVGVSGPIPLLVAVAGMMGGAEGAALGVEGGSPGGADGAPACCESERLAFGRPGDASGEGELLPEETKGGRLYSPWNDGGGKPEGVGGNPGW
jgi:hypothetical protein